MSHDEQPAGGTTPSPAAMPAAPTDAAVLAEATRRSRRAFLGWGLAGLAGVAGWGWLVNRPEVDGIPGPLRDVLDLNGRISSAYFRETRLAPEFARSRAQNASGQRFDWHGGRP